AEADHGTAIQAGVCAGVFGSEVNIGDIAYANGISNNDVLDLLRGDHGGVGADDQLLVLGAEAACRHVESRHPQNRRDITDRQPIAREPQRIDDHSQHALAPAVNLDVGHPVDRDQFRDEVLFGDTGNLISHQVVAQDTDVHYRPRIVVGLDDHDLLEPV